MHAFECDKTNDVHCGVCKTPNERGYLFGITGTLTRMNNTVDVSYDSNFTDSTIYVGLIRTDVFDIGIDTLDW